MTSLFMTYATRTDESPEKSAPMAAHGRSIRQTALGPEAAKHGFATDSRNCPCEPVGQLFKMRMILMDDSDLWDSAVLIGHVGACQNQLVKERATLEADMGNPAHSGLSSVL